MEKFLSAITSISTINVSGTTKQQRLSQELSDTIYVVSLFAIMVILGVGMGVNIERAISGNYVLGSINNESLMNNVISYVNEVRGWYKYNISNVGKELTLEELKIQGAVCYQYSKYYMNRGREDGYAAKIVTIDTGKDAHSIAIISNEMEYCIIDQRYCWCREFGNKWQRWI